MRFALLPIRAFVSILFLVIFLSFAEPALAAECSLCKAAESGDADEVRRLLDGGANPNQLQKSGYTPLIHAAENGHLESVKILLEKGANPNRMGKMSAEMAAEMSADLCVEEKDLMKDNVTKDILDSLNSEDAAAVSVALSPIIVCNAYPGDFWIYTEGFSALMVAESKVVKILIDDGANPNQSNSIGWTALMIAALQDNAESVKALLESGAILSAANQNGDTALDIAFEMHGDSVVNVIQEWERKQFQERQKAIRTQKEREESGKTDSSVAVVAASKTSSEAEKVFENAWRSIVLVRVPGKQGSGVIVKPNLVATNCHVIESGGDIVVYKSDNRRTDKKTKFYAQLGQADYRNDLCLLDVAGLWGIPASVRKYDTLRVGEKVYALGSPAGLDLTYTDGVVSQLRNIDDKAVIQTNAAISPGSSGGGLFDSEANLIGITAFGFDKTETEGLNFAIPADLVLQY